jgi:two-component system response regulator YesN
MRFFEGPGIMVSESDLAGCKFGVLSADAVSQSSFTEAILSRDREKMMQLIDDMLSVIRRIRPEPSVAINYLIEINALIISSARKVMEPGALLSSDLMKFFRICQTLDEIAAGMKQYIEALYDSLDGQWKQRLRGEITDAMNYVAEHYPEYISLHDIAARLHMSTSRFCVVFKEGTGQTFVDYLNMVRIRKAEELLLCPNLTIYDVAYKVGFNSTSYFSKLFKRVTGRFPSDYRRS